MVNVSWWSIARDIRKTKQNTETKPPTTTTTTVIGCQGQLRNPCHWSIQRQCRQNQKWHRFSCIVVQEWNRSNVVPFFLNCDFLKCPSFQKIEILLKVYQFCKKKKFSFSVSSSNHEVLSPVNITACLSTDKKSFLFFTWSTCVLPRCHSFYLKTKQKHRILPTGNGNCVQTSIQLKH